MSKPGIGNRIAPPRFLLFVAILVIGCSVGISLTGWRMGAMLGFDAAALIFVISCAPMFAHSADGIRRAAARNDANRFFLLVITAVVMLAVLASVASELMAGNGEPWSIAMIVATLTLAWVFSNLIYTLHYAHLFYSAAAGNKDAGGFDFPETPEPDYWDFVYFAFCLGMTFQTSDVEITDSKIRKVVTLHCLGAFVFNLGVVAFTINVLGGG